MQLARLEGRLCELAYRAAERDKLLELDAFIFQLLCSEALSAQLLRGVRRRRAQAALTQLAAEEARLLESLH